MDFTMEFSANSPRANAILEGTFLQPPIAGPNSEAGDEEDADNEMPTITPQATNGEAVQDETDSQEATAHTPRHLQRNTVKELTQALVDSFCYATKPDTIPAELTQEEYRGKLKAWDESTSTSPTTNMHLGHLKAYWAEHTLQEGSHEATALEDQRRAILNGHLLLLNYALQTGYSYEPWKRIVNTMLEKDLGIPKIHRLRVIHLYEADYNLILGVKRRQVLHHAVKSNLINKGCYGSQPGKEATNVLFVQELEFKISRMTREASLHFDNNAT